MSVEGAIGVALVDYESGMALGTLGGGRGLDLEIAAAGNTEVVRAKVRTLSMLAIEHDRDILITLGTQYHLIRLLSSSRGSLFLYLALDRGRANLALARHALKRVESDLEV